MDGFKNIDFSKLTVRPHVVPPSIQRSLKQTNDFLDQINQDIEKRQKEKEEYDQELLQSIKNIEANTAGLQEIIPLLQKGVADQAEMLEFFKEVLSMGTLKSKDEVDSKWRNLMDKAKNLTEDVETIQKLHSFANTIYQLVISSFS